MHVYKIVFLPLSSFDLIIGWGMPIGCVGYGQFWFWFGATVDTGVATNGMFDPSHLGAEASGCWLELNAFWLANKELIRI